MEPLNIIMWSIGGLICGVVGSLLTDEVGAWLPNLARRLTLWAANRTPEADRSRNAEEWLAHIYQMPGNISPFVVSIGFLVASERTRTISSQMLTKRMDALNKFVDYSVICGMGIFIAAAFVPNPEILLVFARLSGIGVPAVALMVTLSDVLAMLRGRRLEAD